MPVTITWNDGVNPATQFTVSDDVVTALDSFRQTITVLSGTPIVPMYPTVVDMVMGVFIKNLVIPAITQFPPTTIETALTNLASAQSALAAAQAAVLPVASTVST
jgi:hypothetical protein